MCLLLNKPEPKPKTAKRNIAVYKYLYPLPKPDEFLSPYLQYTWRLGHHDQVPDWMWMLTTNNAEFGCSLKFGFHAFRTKKAALCYGIGDDDEAVLVKCVIPKGAQYYNGKFSEVVSNQMIAVEEV